MPRDRPVCGGHGRQNKPKWVPQGTALAEEVGPLPINQQLSEKSTKCMMLVNKDGCHSHSFGNLSGDAKQLPSGRTGQHKGTL